MTRTMAKKVARYPEEICDLSNMCVGHELEVEEVLSKIVDEPIEIYQPESKGAQENG